MLRGIVLAMSLAAMASGAAAQDPRNPVIAPFGKIAPAPGAAMQPDPKLDYRVVFEISKASPASDKPNPSLEKVARFINLLAAGSVKPENRHVLAIVHGPATELVLDHDAFRARHKRDNPNIALIEALARAGVEVHVCAQALAGQKIARDEVSPAVVIDLSALTTLTTLELKGWSVMSD